MAETNDSFSAITADLAGEWRAGEAGRVSDMRDGPEVGYLAGDVLAAEVSGLEFPTDYYNRRSVIATGYGVPEQVVEIAVMAVCSEQYAKLRAKDGDNGNN